MASDGIRGAALGSSPVRDLSRTLDERIQELDTVLAGLEEVSAETTAERIRVRLALAQAEEVRGQILEHRNLVQVETLADAVRRSGELYARLCHLDARLEGIEERRAGLRSEREQLAQLRPLAAQLETDQSTRAVTADDPGVICRRAERQLHRLVTQDHEAVTDLIVSGPLEDLADVVLAVELIGHRVGKAPARHGHLRGRRVQGGGTPRPGSDASPPLQDQPPGVGGGGPGHLGPTGRRRPHGDRDRPRPGVGEERRLHPPVGLAAFRVVVEAIDNAYRHGRSDEVEVVLAFLPGRLQAVVADHGEGFDVGATEARLGRTRALGLITMRERVENVGGSFEIRSALGAGSEVRAVFTTAWQ